MSEATRPTLLLAGAPRLDWGGRTLPLPERDAALLAWLALEGPTPRARLMALLWPEADAASARNSLRQRLFKLRRRAGAELVQGQETLALAEGLVHDLAEAESVLGDLVPAFGGTFAAWLEQQRERRRGRLRATLEELADGAEAARDWPDAIAHAQELLALSPLSEAAHRRLMRLHYLAGDRAAALLAFDRCERVLKDEIGTAPSAETLALLRALESSARSVPAVRAARTPPPGLLRPPLLVGRRAEWVALQDAWSARSLRLVEGEAGLGKSRLLGDLALAQGPAAHYASARPGDTAVPYAFLARVVRGLVERLDEAGRERLRSRHPALAQVLPEWDAAPAPQPALAEALEAALRAALATSPPLQGLLLDDLHHADAASVDALPALCSATHGECAWVLAYRAADLPAASAELVRGLAELPAAEVLRLQPLDEAAVAALLDVLDLGAERPAGLARELSRHTGGNPLFLLETLKAWWAQAAAGAAAGLPTARSVAQLIERRLARLSPAALRLARCAAVAGQDFDIALATEVLQAQPLDLADAWAELEAAQVLRDAAFAHDLVREAALASVPPVLARTLHGQLALLLARRGAGPERVAEHWLASDTPAAAVPHLREAALRAAQAMRPREAIAAAVRAADLLEPLERSDEALDLLLQVQGKLFAPTDADSFALVERMAGAARTAHQQARVGERRAELLARGGDFAAAGRVASAALALISPAEHPALAAALLCSIAAGDLAAGDNDRAIERMHRAVELAARSGDPETECTAANYMGSVFEHAGRPADAYLAIRRSLELGERHRRPCAEVIANLGQLAGNRSIVGDYEAALEHVRRAQALAAENDIDLPALWPSMRVHEALSNMVLGRYVLALRLYEDVLREMERYMPAWLPAVYNQTALMWMHLGQWARARQDVQRSLESTTLARYRIGALQIKARIDDVLRAPGAPPAAVPAEGDDATVPPVLAHSHALYLTTAWPPERAYAECLRLLAQARQRQMPNQVLEAEVRCAQAATRAGDPARASGHALAVLERMRETLPSGMCRGEMWLAAVQALAPVDPARANEVLQTAAAWLRTTAREHVPGEFRESFLERNAANRELLALASRGA